MIRWAKAQVDRVLESHFPTGPRSRGRTFASLIAQQRHRAHGDAVVEGVGEGLGVGGGDGEGEGLGRGSGGGSLGLVESPSPWLPEGPGSASFPSPFGSAFVWL